MTAAHEPSMDDILKSIRRIIRSDQDEASANTNTVASTADEPLTDNDDNLIKMEIQDQKRVRILEKKLQTLETEYEHKLTLHRRKMSEYRQKNKELAAVAEDHKAKLRAVTDSLKAAHDCLEKMDADNRRLNGRIQKMNQEERGSVVLRTIQKEFVELYHPERVTGDPISKAVRQEIYNEFSRVLKGVKNRFQMGSV